jgi:membrane-bound lytic murein transglycosylase B
MRWIATSGLLLFALLPLSVYAAPDPAFTQFVASLWPEAQAAGVSRATFDAETKGLEPDYKLPDLILPGRPATGAPSQAEFVSSRCPPTTSRKPLSRRWRPRGSV